MSSGKDNTYADSDNRLLYLSDDVDNSTIGKLCWELVSILQEDDKKEEEAKKEKDKKKYIRKPIKIYINSFGGRVYDMWALIDIILGSKTPIYTYCTGYAMSAGFNIFLAGHKRYASEHATFMYHQMWQSRSGKYQDLVEDREEVDVLQKMIEEYVLDRTNFSRADIKEVRERKRDFYIHAKDALKLGIVDKIIKKI